MLAKLQRFNVLIGILLAGLVLFIGSQFHLPEGWPRLLLVAAALAAWAVPTFLWKPRPPASPLS